MAFKSDSKDKKSSWGKKSSGGSSGAEKLYTLQIELAADRSVGCEIEIAGSHTLQQLQETIDEAFGRIQKRMWAFQTGRKGQHASMNRRYGPPDLGDDMADDASETAFDDLKLKLGDSFGYVFDVDHPCEHAIEITNVMKAGRTGPDPRISRKAIEMADAVEEARPEVRPRAPERVAARPARPARIAGPAEPVVAVEREDRARSGEERGDARGAQAAPGAGADVGGPPRAERNEQAAACSYILVALLQRLETVQPGLTGDLLAGIEADRAAIDAQTSDRDFIERVFDEALKTVRQAKAGIA